MKSLYLLGIENIVNSDIKYEENKVNSACDELLEMFKTNDKDWIKTFNYACASGSMSIVRCLFENNINDIWAISHASFNGHLNIMQFLIENHDANLCKSAEHQCMHLYDALYKAAKGGQLEAMQLLISYGVKITNEMYNPLKASIMAGHLHIIKYLIEELQMNIASLKFNKNNYNVLIWALISGHLNIVEYIVNHHKNDNFIKNYIKPFALQDVAMCGHLDVMKYLIEQFQINDFNDALSTACTHGHLNMVEYLISEAGADASANDHNAIQQATRKGHLNIIQYLLDNTNTIIHIEAFYSAVSYGQFEIVKYFIRCASDARLRASPNHEKYNIPSHNFAVMHAADSGHLEIMKYLIARGFALGMASQIASMGDNLEIINFLHNYEHGNESGDDEAEGDDNDDEEDDE